MTSVSPAIEPQHRYRRVVWLLRTLLALAVLAALAAWTGPREVLARLGSVPLPSALAALLLTLLVQWLGAVRLSVLAAANGLPLRWPRALHIGMSAVFYGLFLPGGNVTGWIVRLLRLSGDAANIGNAVMALAADRALATAALAVMGLAVDIVLGAPLGPAVTVLLVAVSAASIVLACLASLVPGPRVPAALARLSWLAGLLARLPRQQLRMRSAQTSRLLLAAVISLALHGVGILVWLLLARGLGLEVSVLALAWVRSAAMVVGLVPLTVAGLGLREGAVVFLMSVFGVGGAESLTLSLLAFAITVLAVGVLGGVVEAGLLLRRSR